MAAGYSTGEAKQVIKEHERLLGFLRTEQTAQKQLAAEAQRQLQSLLARDAFGSHIKSEIKANASVAPGFELERFISSLRRLALKGEAAQKSKRLLDGYEREISHNLQAARAGSSGLRRLFSSSDAKNRAEQAHNVLLALLEGEYGTAAKALEAQAAQSDKLSAKAAAEDFFANKAHYRAALLKAMPELFKTGALIREFDSLLKKVEQINSGLQNADSAVEARRQGVRNAAEALRYADAVKILSEVPVEEVNRGSEKLRVKSLRDAGYENMADILQANERQLSSVNGISAEGAQRLKKIAQRFLSKSANTVGIKLSYDDRRSEATGLVCAVYEYKSIRAGIEEIGRLKKDYAADIDKASATLTNTGNGAPWLFYSDDEKQQVISAYAYLSDLLSGSYAQSVSRVSSLLSGKVKANANDAWNDFKNNPIEYNSILEELAPDAIGNDDSVYGLPEELAQAIAEQEVLTDGLSCTLRPYQTWGVKYILHQKRVLLGDEMGLGKTVQAIASMVSLRNSGDTHFMVICPASVISNWCREIEKHSNLTVTKLHGSSRASAFAEWLEKGGAAVTTFETTAHLNMENGKIGMVVVDEAHYIKNPGAMRTKNVKKLCEHADKILFMTGTALENKVEEMIELIKILRPELAQSVSGMAFMASAPQFREEIAPVYYRRKRADVLKELPELTSMEEWCQMTAEEERVYENAVLSGNYASVRRVSWNVPDIGGSSKANRLLEIAAEAESEERKLIVFSFFLDTISKISALFGEKCVGPINGLIPPARRQELIDEFDRAPSGSVLAAQIQSGGTGLNIQSASVVVLCEPQFKPSIENQAISRAYRMGQSRNVLVYRLLCENTADEKIMKLLEQKQAVFNAFADDSAVADETFELDERGFGEIVKEEAQRIAEKHAQEQIDNKE